MSSSFLVPLRQRLADLGADGVVLAFSGGVDSAVLLAALVQAVPADQCLAVFFAGPSQTQAELDFATNLAANFGVELEIQSSDALLADPHLRRNPQDRCYWCKRSLFATLKETALSRGFRHVLDGTNADDARHFRPGQQALSELGILSPLKEFGMTKRDVRELAQEICPQVADKPAAPCLATRFDYGTLLTAEAFRAVEECEEALRTWGIHPVRLRVQGDLARLEVPQKLFSLVLQRQFDILALLKQHHFRFVTLDLEGLRSGCYDN